MLPGVIQRSFKEVLCKFQRSSEGVSGKFQRRFRSVSQVIQESLERPLKQDSRGISSGFQACFKGFS